MLLPLIASPAFTVVPSPQSPNPNPTQFHALALATFALASATPQILKLSPLEHFTGGVQGIVVTKPDAPFGLPLSGDQWLYFFTLAVGVVLYILARNLVNSRAGRALLAKAGRGDWGFGRHTVGSNYFHYIQDPWGSWFEYFSDMDHIDDYSLWTPTNYGPEDSMANWAPELPKDFVYNYEAEEAAA